MSRYRKIDTRIWNDAKFRGLTDDGKMVFLYVLTHPSMTALGAMRASVEGLAHELKWLPERFRKGLAEPLSQGMIEVDEAADLVALPNFLRYNAADNGNVVKAWASCLDMLPECDLKTSTIQRAWSSLQDRPKSMKDAFKEAFNGIPNGIGNRSGNGIDNRMPNQEQEQEQEPEQDSQALEHREGTYTHAREREPTEYPIDPPETYEQASAFLKSHGVPAQDMEAKLQKLMGYRLYPSELAAYRRAA